MLAWREAVGERLFWSSWWLFSGWFCSLLDHHCACRLIKASTFGPCWHNTHLWLWFRRIFRIWNYSYRRICRENLFRFDIICILINIWCSYQFLFYFHGLHLFFVTVSHLLYHNSVHINYHALQWVLFYCFNKLGRILQQWQGSVCGNSASCP